MELKGGFETQDPRLDFIPQKDERSREFPAIRLLTMAERRNPITMDWGLAIRLDQGQEGQCVCYSLSHSLAADPNSQKGFMEDSPKIKEWITRRYREAQREDPWPGEEYEGTSLLAGAKILNNMGLITEYRWAFGEDEMAVSLGHIGPACIGVNWYSGMRDPDENGLLKVSGDRIGGHAIMVRGIDVEKGLYRLTNSWGRGWGIDGECFITREDMCRLLAEEGECVLPISKSTQQIDFSI